MPAPDLKPARRQSTVEVIAEELRAAIMSGRLNPGDQLGEADLAEQFAVSRGPLREAMQRLVSEGILQAVVNRGVFVSELTLADMIDVYRTRSIIELGALEIILQGRREQAYAALESTMELMRGAARDADASAVSDADLRFHEVLVECSASSRLMRAMRTLMVETRLCLGELETTYSDLSAQLNEHEELREALRSDSSSAVGVLLQAHLDDAVERLVSKRTASAP